MKAHVELDDLSALLDGELSAARTAEVRAHLESCVECEGRRAGLERSVESLRGLGRAAPPPGLLQRVQRQAATLSPQPSLLDRLGDWLHPPALRPAFAGVLAMLSVAVLAVFAFHSYSARQEAALEKQQRDQVLEAYVRSGIPPAPTAPPPAAASEPALQERAAAGAGAARAAHPDAGLAAADSARAGGRGDQSASVEPGRRVSIDATASLSDERQKKEAAIATGAVAGGPQPAVAEALAKATTSTETPSEPENELKDKLSAQELDAAPAAPAAPTPELLVESRQVASSPAKPSAPATPMSRRVSGKVFERVAAGWRERGVDLTQSVIVLAADSAAGKRLQSRMPGLEALLHDGTVVLRDGNDLVELLPAKGR